MNILFVIPYAPNLVRVRPFNLLRFINQRNHHVTLLTLTSEAFETQPLHQLAEEGIQVKAFPLTKKTALFNSIKALATQDPIQAHYCWQPQLANHLMELLSIQNETPPIDVIHIEHLRGVRYGIFLKTKYNSSRQFTLPPIVWDAVDSITHLFKQSSRHSQSLISRLLSLIELPRTRRLEAKMVGFFEKMLVTSPTDREAFLRISPPNKGDTITVLPNGVDLEYFTPPLTEQRQPYTLVVSGKMSYHANIAMVYRLVREILPLVWSRNPEIQLVIAGKDPPAAIQQMAQDRRITVTGTVPDLRPYLQNAALAVTPLSYGAGIQNKVLEAMACATPVITSTQTLSALMAKPGKDLIVAETNQDFADAILQLINDPQRLHALGQAGRHYVETHHNWQTIASNLEQIYLSLK